MARIAFAHHHAFGFVYHQINFFLSRLNQFAVNFNHIGRGINFVAELGLLPLIKTWPDFMNSSAFLRLATPAELMNFVRVLA